MKKIIYIIIIFILISNLISCNPNKAPFNVTQNGELINRNDTYDFGEIPINQFSEEVVFTIENIGNEAFNVTGVILDGDNPEEFVITPDSISEEIQPDDTLIFNLIFSPNMQQKSTADVIISTDLLEEDDFTFTISGIGTEALNNWTDNNPASTPPARINHGMAYAGNNKFIIYGGIDSSISRIGDTWEYDLTLNIWTDKNPTASPGDLTNFGMTHTDDFKVIIFGGFNGSRLDDTWEYDISGNVWTLLSPSGTIPDPRNGHKLINGRNGNIYMFGGRETDWTNELWEYNVSGNSWNQLSPSGNIPNPRSKFGFAYGGDDKLVLFGGVDINLRLNDTWVYDISDNQWTEKTPATIPHARDSHDMTYIGNNTVMMFGGYYMSGSTSQYYNDTWHYNLDTDTWTEMVLETKPDKRYQHRVAMVDGMNTVIMFGGYYFINDNNIYYDDTWAYTFP